VPPKFDARCSGVRHLVVAGNGASRASLLGDPGISTQRPLRTVYCWLITVPPTAPGGFSTLLCCGGFQPRPPLSGASLNVYSSRSTHCVIEAGRSRSEPLAAAMSMRRSSQMSW